MPYSKKIVLHCPDGAAVKLEQLVEDFKQGGVTFIAVVGKDCAWVEDLIDGFVVGDGTKDRKPFRRASRCLQILSAPSFGGSRVPRRAQRPGWLLFRAPFSSP
jgi:hypothetical protein